MRVMMVNRYKRHLIRLCQCHPHLMTDIAGMRIPGDNLWFELINLPKQFQRSLQLPLYGEISQIPEMRPGNQLLMMQQTEGVFQITAQRQNCRRIFAGHCADIDSIRHITTGTPQHLNTSGLITDKRIIRPLNDFTVMQQETIGNGTELLKCCCVIQRRSMA